MYRQTHTLITTKKGKTLRSSVALTAAIGIIFLLGSHSPCASLTHKDILRYADRARGNLDGVEWQVTIHSIEKGREQDRQLEVKARGYDFLAIMTSPPKVKRHKLLMVDHNMWFAKPGIKKPVPVSSRQKLIGGASYGDIAATNYATDYVATRTQDQVVNGEGCYVFDLEAVTNKATYDRIKYWVSKRRIVGVKAQYYTVSGKIIKEAAFEYANRVQLRDKYHPFISKMIITDALIKDNVTTLNFGKPDLIEVPPSALDVNLLLIR
jgi:outer membrane lipoprotein-sorting protein